MAAPGTVNGQAHSETEVEILQNEVTEVILAVA
jgi:hypothetical protein